MYIIQVLAVEDITGLSGHEFNGPSPLTDLAAERRCHALRGIKTMAVQKIGKLWWSDDQIMIKSSTIKNWRTFGQTMTNPCSMLRWLADRVPRPLRVPNNRGASFVTKILPNSQNLPWPNKIHYYDHLQLSTAATVSPQQVEPLGRVFHFQCRHIPAVSQRLAESCHARRSRHVDWSRFDSQNMAWVCMGFVLNAGLCYSCLAFCNIRHLFQPQKCCAWHCLTNLSKLTGWGCHHRAKPCQTLNALHFFPKTYMFFGGRGCMQNAHV